MPVEGITVDGDLSDWPDDLERYPICRPGRGILPTYGEDLTAWFRVAYSKADSTLYVAAEAVDDTISAQDGCLVYIGDPHGAPAAEREAVTVAEDSGHVHEFGIRVSRLSASTFGFDILVIDVDSGSGRTEVSWGAGPQTPWGSRRRPGALGDVVLAPLALRGWLEGVVHWSAGQPAGRVQVTARSQSDSSLWVRTMTDRAGVFTVELPPGRYGVSALNGRAETVIEHGGRCSVSLVGSARGRSVRATEDLGVLAGPGRGMGQWHTYGYADGFPPFTVSALAQDAEGALWIGTGLYAGGTGVVRYDGTRLQAHTVSSGLASDEVRAIAIDQDGSVWVACMGGVSRYDEGTWTTYTTADGLVDDRVRDVLATEEGGVWFATCRGVSRFDGDVFTNYTVEDGLAGGEVTTLAEDAGAHVWAATGAGYLYRFDGSSWTGAPHPHSMRRIDDMLFDQDGRLWLGGSGASVCTTDSCASPIQVSVNSLALDLNGEVWVTTWGDGIRRCDGSSVTTYHPSDGISNDQMFASLVDEDGDLWFGSMAGGLSRYRQQTATYTSADGLLHDLVFSVIEDSGGHIWAGTLSGVSRFDGSVWTSWGGGDVPILGTGGYDLLETSDGTIWVATNAGVARFDGRDWRSYTQEDGLTVEAVDGIAEDREGRIWVANWFGGTDAVNSFDGSQWATHRMDYRPRDIWAAPDESLWFGGAGRVSRLCRGAWTHYGAADGLPAGMEVWSITGEPGGTIWVATMGDGLMGYDGSRWTATTTADGLSHDKVTTVLRDSRGHQWVGTWGGGVNLHNGEVYQRILEGDGLGSDLIQEAIEASNGDMWIATEGGITRYRPTRVPPVVRVTGLATDRPLAQTDSVSLPSTQDYLLVEFEGASLRTSLDHLVYGYRLLGMHDEWRYTRERRVEFSDLPIGEYVFQVRAVDQDLNYSEPYTMSIEVVFPYAETARWAGSAAACLIAASALLYGTRRRRDQRQAEQALMRDMEEELQTAHDMQIGLMPTASPEVTGVALAGRCVSANHVGGDFYQYFERDGSLTVSLADVTGHAMEAAIPAVMFSGVLDKQMEFPSGLEDRFASLNRSLCRSLGEHTFVCLSMVDLDPASRTMRLANCGCPYPLHYQAGTGEIAEVEVDAYPLGVRTDTEYAAVEVALGAGDYLVVHSDGFSEATSSEEQLFGFDRTMEVIRQGCSENLSPEDLIERLIGEVKAFTGDEPQADDMTCVVIKVEA